MRTNDEPRAETGIGEILHPSSALLLPHFPGHVACGFPSPAEEYLEERLDISKYLVRNELATFYVYAKGDSMTDAQIADGALLIIDRSVVPRSTSKVLCYYDNGFTVKFLKKTAGKLFLQSANDKHPPIEVKEGVQFQVWGTVTYSINSHHRW